MTTISKLLELVNTGNPLSIPLTSDIVSFSDPVINYGVNWNTQITITANPGYYYTGSVNVFYKRIDLSVLNKISLLSDVPFTPEIIVSILKNIYNADVVINDFIPIDIPNLNNVGDTGTVVIEADSKSIGWNGKNDKVDLLFGLPFNINTLHQLLVDILPSPGYLT